MSFSGLHAFTFCEGIKDTVESIWNSVKMFVDITGSKSNSEVVPAHPVPDYLLEANLKFMKEAMNWEWEERETQKVEIDPSLVQSGDFLGVLRMDGLASLIMYGTGATISHNVMALRMEDDELYIVESTGNEFFGFAIQRTKWADWMDTAEKAGMIVTWHRMRDDVRAKFDTEAAIEWFHQTEGMPYGGYNFIYGWIDTPEGNWPPYLPATFLPVVISIMEKVAP